MQVCVAGSYIISNMWEILALKRIQESIRNLLGCMKKLKRLTKR